MPEDVQVRAWVNDFTLLTVINVNWKGDGQVSSWNGANKETNRQQQPDSSIHDTPTHCPLVQPSFNFADLMVAERTVTKISPKKLTEWQNNRKTVIESRKDKANPV